MNEKHGTCCVFLSAKIESYDFLEGYDFREAFIIAVDGGLVHTQKLGILPDLAMGDFDTCPEPRNVNTVSYPTDKDYTDGYLAVDYAIKTGFKEIVLIGALGGRIDHELGNIFMLKNIYSAGILGKVVNENNEIYLTCDNMNLTKGNKKYLSIVPVTEIAEVTASGLLYSVKNYTMNQWLGQGISNEIVESSCKITVHNGVILIIKSKD